MRVLMIGGTKSLAHAINRELGERKCQVRYVADGDLGLEVALKYQFDLIVLEWCSPKKDGLSVMMELRERKRTPILLLTAGESLTDVLQMLESDAVVCVSKPAGIHETISKMKLLLNRSKWTRNPDSNAGFETVADTRAVPKAEQHQMTPIKECTDHKACKTRLKSDNLWECLANRYMLCIYRTYYGPKTYCLHELASGFSLRSIH